MAGLFINFLSSAFRVGCDAVFKVGGNCFSECELQRLDVGVYELADPDHVVWGHVRGGSV
jgi:hypothetical protein